MKKTTDVVEYIKQKIVTGEINPGERLHSIKKLAELCEVSTITVRNAIEQLTREGFVETRERSGCFVKAPDNKLLHLAISDEYNIQDAIVDVQALSHSKVSGLRLRPTDDGQPRIIDQAVRIDWLYTTFFNAPIAYEECLVAYNDHKSADRLLAIDDRKELEMHLAEKKRTTMEVRLVTVEPVVQQQMHLEDDALVFLFEKMVHGADGAILAACKACILPDNVLFFASN